MKPMFDVGSVPRPAPGHGLPFALYPADTMGSGRLRSCVGRCRAASYCFCAATISGFFASASAMTSARAVRAGVCAIADAETKTEMRIPGNTRISTSIKASKTTITRPSDARIPVTEDSSRDRSLDQEGDEERGEIEQTQTRRRRLDGTERLWRWRNAHGVRQRRRCREIGADFNARLNRRRVVPRRGLIAAAALRDLGSLAAVVLLGGADRVNRLRKQRPARRRDHRGDDAEGSEFPAQTCHSTPV